ncbi:GDP-mannose 4,6-dehydratase [Occallatibacter savannae]|uniref:GDP-mannose 4,6-dehydratase n=1 Tax=Occallatibacter savannae TaxID=1002691 RepID=UPI000D686282|nr:GDP-mannose 4,6-dehydratase [Occallatibacter savannae]
MRVLITGGAGFIGSHLAERHIELGDEVVVLDDLSTGRIQNLRLILQHPKFSFQQGSVMDLDVTSKAVEKCDIVYHLAASVGVRRVVDDPIGTIERNVSGTMCVLRAVDRFKKRLLFTSTSEVYGKSAKVPFSEDDDIVLGPTVKPRWGYGCSKAVDEFLIQAYMRQHGLYGVIVRLFNTVGPRQLGNYGMVIPTLVRQAMKQQPLTVFGTGEQMRCFLHVSDAVHALTQLASESSAKGRVVNLGGTEEISVNDLARRIKAITTSSSQIHNIPYDDALGPGFEDIDRRVPDCTRVRQLIGFSPKFDIDAILRSVVGHELSEKEGQFASGALQ